MSKATPFSILPLPSPDFGQKAEGKIAVNMVGDTVYMLYKNYDDGYLYMTSFEAFDHKEPPVTKKLSSQTFQGGITAEVINLVSDEGEASPTFFLITVNQGKPDANYISSAYLNPDGTHPDSPSFPSHANDDWTSHHNVAACQYGDVIYMSWIHAATKEISFGYYEVNQDTYTFVGRGAQICSTDNTSNFGPSLLQVPVEVTDQNGDKHLIPQILLLWVQEDNKIAKTVLYDPTKGTFDAPYSFDCSNDSSDQVKASLLLRPSPPKSYYWIAPSGGGIQTASGLNVYTPGNQSTKNWSSDTLPTTAQPYTHLRLGQCHYLFYADQNNDIKYLL